MQGCGPDSGSLGAKVQPPAMPVIHVSPRFSLHSPLPTPGQRSAFSQSSRQQYDNIVSLSGSFILHIPNLQQSASQCVYRQSDLFTQNPPCVCGLGLRHTAQTFGRDSAANSATMHLDWLSVSCPLSASTNPGP